MIGYLLPLGLANQTEAGIPQTLIKRSKHRAALRHPFSGGPENRGVEGFNVVGVEGAQGASKLRRLSQGPELPNGQTGLAANSPVEVPFVQKSSLHGPKNQLETETSFQ